MAIFIKLTPSTFRGSTTEGRWIARTVSQGEVHTKDIAEIIQENTSFKKADVVGVLTELVETMTRELQNGNTVVLDGFGRFHLSVQAKSVASPKEFSISEHVRKVKCNFVPAGRRGVNNEITSKALLDGVEVDMQPYYDVEKGKKK